ncbi:MAG TPA: hypothetical protein VIF09_08745 [Polyangiaceae bacterium]
MTGAAPPTLPVASFKLQLAERRVRIVPSKDLSGCAFAGPGVDLVDAEAVAVFADAAPLLRWLEAREPVRVRSLSFDVARRRLLVTVEDVPRPRVVKIDPGVDAGAADELLGLAGPLLRRLGEIAAGKLVSRESGQH